MNTTFLHIITIISSLCFMGCEDEYDPSGNLQPSLSAHWLRPTETNFDHYLSSAFTENFSVESFETPWMFSNVADWISLTPSSGNASARIILNAQENTNADYDRTTIFYLRSTDPDWNYSRAMSVSQGKATPSLTLSESSLSFGGGASQQTVDISSNCSWTATCSDSWVTLTPDLNHGQLSISLQPNPQTNYRRSTVYISYGPGSSRRSAYLYITQYPSDITASASSLQYDNVASKYDVTINSEADWSSTVSDSWISVNPNSGSAGSTSVAIEVTPNASTSSRTGYVAVKTGTAERLQIAIQQKGNFIEADENLSFSSSQESKTLNIRSNTSWTITGKPNWVSISKNSGEGNGEITVTTTDNPNTTSRTGEIVIEQIGLSLQCKVRVTQSGKSLSTGVRLLEFSDKASQISFNLVSDASWTSSLTADWFNVTPTSGRGNATITVAAEDNLTTEERTGSIIYAYADRSSYVNVHQLAKYMTIDNQSFAFDSKGGSHTIDLSTNDEWTAEIEHDVSWLKLSKTSGTGNAVITLTADDNASVNTRSTAVVINTKYAQSIRILVSQSPRHLTLSTASILFYANGGTSETVSIDTDGTYEIKSDASWFTINKGEGNSFTLYATKNSSNEIRRATVTISLTDLKEGSLSLELSVIQAGEGGSFIINGFPEDSDWNHIGNGSLTLTVKGYTADQNWDESFGGTLTVKVTGYSTDQDWNINDRSSGRVSINTYGADSNWNE